MKKHCQPTETFCYLYETQNAHSIIFKTSQDLNDFARKEKFASPPTTQINSQKSIRGQDNREFVMATIRNRKNGVNSYDILQEENIDIPNAVIIKRVHLRNTLKISHNTDMVFG